MGGADATIKRAREDYKAGQYRWVASVMSKVVFADPANKEARALGADALEQLGYQSEAATWRNAYLLGAFELAPLGPILIPIVPAEPPIKSTKSFPPVPVTVTVPVKEGDASGALRFICV